MQPIISLYIDILTTTNSLRQYKLVRCVCGFNLLMVGPLTIQPGTKRDKSSAKHKLQVCNYGNCLKAF